MNSNVEETFDSFALNLGIISFARVFRRLRGTPKVRRPSQRGSFVRRRPYPSSNLGRALKNKKEREERRENIGSLPEANSLNAVCVA